MTDSINPGTRSKWSWLPPVRWLGGYQAAWLPGDMVAGVTLAAYAIPVSLAYASLAGLPPQVGIYGYLLGGLGYALLGSSRQLAVGPTSAISLMIAASVAPMAEGDAERYVQIASLAAFTVAGLCLLAWLFRLSVLVTLISDSILVGFKIGAGLTIAMTQLPSLFGIAGGGHNFFERVYLLVGQLGHIQLVVLAMGAVAIAMLLMGERWLPGRPVALAVVALSIFLATVLGLPAIGVPVTGNIPEGLPTLAGPALRLRDVEGIVPLAAGCLLLAYIEGVSAARTFAAKHGYDLDPRQEFLGIGAANLGAALGHGYPVAGGLSQSAVNDKAGAHTPLALLAASTTLALCLLFLTGLLENLPKAVLAAVVLTAILGLFDFRGLLYMWRVSRIDFYAATTAIMGVLLLGILQGILLAALISILLLLARASRPRRSTGAHPRNQQLFGSRRHRRDGAEERDRLPPRSLTALCQCWVRPRNSDGQCTHRSIEDPCGGLRSLRIALPRSRGCPHFAYALRSARGAGHFAADCRSAWPRAGSAAGRWSRREGRRTGARRIPRRRN
jgi:high affinity sulfate transporter 1